MTESAQFPVLHHYPISPFAEKIRAVLGYKGLEWKSVLIPMVMPKPDVVALTGGYRRTPILQIGADVYCDTWLILRVIERLKPSPTLFPDGDTLAVRAMEQFADGVMFNVTVPIGFQPGGGMIKLYFPDAKPEFLQQFGRDRAAMRQGGTVRRGPLGECKANFAGLLPALEAQLKGDYLYGAKPCAADFSLYHVLWPVWKVADTRAMLQPFPRVLKYVERMAAIGNGKSTEMTSADALALAKSSKPAAISGAVALETDGIPLGGEAQCMPVDYALDPVKGELLQASAEEIVIRRTDPRAGTVHVHFPRLGYQLNKPN